MKVILALLFACTAAVAADPGPRCVIPRADGNQRHYLHRVWCNPGGGGCDIIAYHLFAYTELHPERVKYVGETT